MSLACPVATPSLGGVAPVLDHSWGQEERLLTVSKWGWCCGQGDVAHALAFRPNGVTIVGQ